MDTSAASNVNALTSQAAASSTDSTAAITGSINMNKNDFLQLLMAQLQNQDPLSPEDPKDFVSQLAQFSSLEQQINTNSNLSDLSTAIKGLQQSQSMAQGVSLLGKTVQGNANTLSVAGGQAFDATYQLPQAAAQVAVGIFDSTGKQVATLNLGAQSAGNQVFSWTARTAAARTPPTAPTPTRWRPRTKPATPSRRTTSRRAPSSRSTRTSRESGSR